VKSGKVEVSLAAGAWLKEAHVVPEAPILKERLAGISETINSESNSCIIATKEFYIQTVAG
jgi:hypothetical protein